MGLVSAKYTYRTLFLYPLSAFFVVFCNIVGTLDRGDYELMRDITERLSHFKDDPHLRKLLNLLQSLERLCRPLFSEQARGMSTTGSNTLGGGEPVSFAGGNEHSTSPITMEAAAPTDPLHDDMVRRDEHMPGMELDFSADWMMWQLFNSQIPAGWFHEDDNPFGV